jgi:hypothetical protein
VIDLFEIAVDSLLHGEFQSHWFLLNSAGSSHSRANCFARSSAMRRIG